MSAQVLIRESTLDDLESLLKIAQHMGYGLTHLPRDKAALHAKIKLSIASFAKSIDTLDNELYLFVMEEMLTHEVIACCAIMTQVGDSQPLYHYKISQHIQSSETLGIAHKNSFLQLTNDYQGLSELGMLALLPEYQHLHYGKFLSRVRFLYLADNTHRVTGKIIAQMRGIIDEQGACPFWEAIGQKFIDISFLEVDALIAKGEAKFVAELLPDTPIALDLLPEGARAVIGKTHPATQAALNLLQKEGFTFENYINIFEGGPCIELYIHENPTIRNSLCVKLAQINAKVEGQTYMIATHQPFRACLGAVALGHDNTIAIDTQTAHYLNIQLGASLRISL